MYWCRTVQLCDVQVQDCAGLTKPNAGQYRLQTLKTIYCSAVTGQTLQTLGSVAGCWAVSQCWAVNQCSSLGQCSKVVHRTVSRGAVVMGAERRGVVQPLVVQVTELQGSLGQGNVLLGQQLLTSPSRKLQAWTMGTGQAHATCWQGLYVNDLYLNCQQCWAALGRYSKLVQCRKVLSVTCPCTLQDTKRTLCSQALLQTASYEIQ